MNSKIKKYALSLGFDLVAITTPDLPKPELDFYKSFLKKEYFGKMEYLKKISERENPNKILPKISSVICLGINYYHEQSPTRTTHGKVSIYAYGRDYHKIIFKKLKYLQAYLQTIYPNEIFKSYIDTGPILERSYAQKSGLGVIGKNSCLITKEFGTFVFLAEILTTANIKKGKPQSASKEKFPLCKTCDKCIKACPAKAIISAGEIDARKCVSYLTIEKKSALTKQEKLSIASSGYIFGCDICQKVCPHNCRAKQTNHKEFLDPKIAGDDLNLKKILAIKTDEEFLKTFAGSPLMRTKRKGLQRNAKALK
jgi:epoxyqueuosine reductase